jgi:hypothetical protein
MALPAFDTTDLLQIVANPNLLVADQLTLDSADNLYVAWFDADGRLRFSLSKDKAPTWSSPVTFSAPEVTDARYAGLATQQPGTLAAAYYGSTDGVKYNGYVTETTLAFDPAPTFASVVINDPQSATTTRCTWDPAAHAKSPYQGVIGRMVHAVSERWGVTNPVDPDRYKTTCELGPSSTQACRTVADGEAICEELGSCVCDQCACVMLECEKYPDCKAVRQCATKNNCRGIDCLVPCGDTSLEAGDLMTTRALQVADCLNAHSCPKSCP